METIGNKNKHNLSKLYSCDKCNYTTVRKNNYTTHMNCTKHLMATSGNESKHNLSNLYECINCNKRYKDRTGLWKHKKKCIEDTEEPFDKEIIMTLLKQTAEQNKQNAELQATVIQMCKNGITNNIVNNTNSHNNKTFNLQFFLNETFVFYLLLQTSKFFKSSFFQFFHFLDIFKNVQKRIS